MEHSGPIKPEAVFRSPLVLRVLTIVVFMFWLIASVWIALYTLREHEWLAWHIYAGLFVFDIIFFITARYHHVHRVVLDPQGLTIAGLIQVVSYHWDEIIKHEHQFGICLITRDGRMFALSPLDTENFDAFVHAFTRYRMTPFGKDTDTESPMPPMQRKKRSRRRK